MKKTNKIKVLQIKPKGKKFVLKNDSTKIDNLLEHQIYATIELLLENITNTNNIIVENNAYENIVPTNNSAKYVWHIKHKDEKKNSIILNTSSTGLYKMIFDNYDNDDIHEIKIHICDSENTQITKKILEFFKNQKYGTFAKYIILLHLDNKIKCNVTNIEKTYNEKLNKMYEIFEKHENLDYFCFLTDQDKCTKFLKKIKIFNAPSMDDLNKNIDKLIKKISYWNELVKTDTITEIVKNNMFLLLGKTILSNGVKKQLNLNIDIIQKITSCIKNIKTANDSVKIYFELLRSIFDIKEEHNVTGEKIIHNIPDDIDYEIIFLKELVKLIDFMSDKEISISKLKQLIILFVYENMNNKASIGDIKKYLYSRYLLVVGGDKRFLYERIIKNQQIVDIIYVFIKYFIENDKQIKQAQEIDTINITNLEDKVKVKTIKTKRTVSLAQKKYIAGKQFNKCANKPKSKLLGLEDYMCPLWKRKDKNAGCFDQSGYEIDHIKEFSLTHDDNNKNLQALCKSCHTVKTKKFNMTKKKDNI